MPQANTGYRVRLLRERKGLSKTELAVKAGISISYVVVLEQGRSWPTLRTARRVADALGVSVDTLWPILDDDIAPPPQTA